MSVQLLSKGARGAWTALSHIDCCLSLSTLRQPQLSEVEGGGRGEERRRSQAPGQRVQIHVCFPGGFLRNQLYSAADGVKGAGVQHGANKPAFVASVWCHSLKPIRHKQLRLQDSLQFILSGRGKKGKKGLEGPEAGLSTSLSI